MSDQQFIIETEALTRAFKDTLAVDRLNLAIPAGELFGLVGPDGAGKTTTLRLLSGLLEISNGSGIIAGFDLAREAEAIKAHIGYMAQQFSLYAELTVLENLQFFAEIYEVDTAVLAERTQRLLSFAGLTEFKNRRGMHLSGGMQKKLALACALIYQPEILLLDEPTTGVDPISRREFWDILTELHLEGTTVVVSTPYMDEADRCSRVGLMYNGRMIVCDRPDRIRASLKGEIIEVQAAEWQEARSFVEGLPGVAEVQTYGESLHILVDSADLRMPGILRAMEENGYQYKRIRQAPPRMEEAFVSLIQQIESKSGFLMTVLDQDPREK